MKNNPKGMSATFIINFKSLSKDAKVIDPKASYNPLMPANITMLDLLKGVKN